jgi:predicted phage terminase large subunit-like protein
MRTRQKKLPIVQSWQYQYQREKAKAIEAAKAQAAAEASGTTIKQIEDDGSIESKLTVIKEKFGVSPQPGPQTEFLNTTADIVLYGGSAFGGKSFAIILEPLKYALSTPGYNAVVFRRTSPMITNEGGLWDEAIGLYKKEGIDLDFRFSDHSFEFKAKRTSVRFAHLVHDTTVYDWQGSQICFIGFDELTHFSESQFFYMLSRNRSMCGVRPYIRCTTNPDADSWVAKLIEWWIDQETGYAIPDRSGVIRYFVRVNGEIFWGDTREELDERFPEAAAVAKGQGGEFGKSFTFIAANFKDNAIGREKDPNYITNLLSLPLVERERLLGGNWKIKPAAGKVFNRDWFEIVDHAPIGGMEVRFWDLAATEKKLNPKTGKAKNDPDYTASCKMRRVGDTLYILDITADQIGPSEADNKMKNTASQEGKTCAVRWEKEGGATGVRDTAHLTKLLMGYNVGGIDPQGDKITRAKPLASQAEAGNVKFVRSTFTDPAMIEVALNHLHGQPDLPHDDIMDACSGAFNYLSDNNNPLAGLTPLIGLGISGWQPKM